MPETDILNQEALQKRYNEIEKKIGALRLEKQEVAALMRYSHRSRPGAPTISWIEAMKQVLQDSGKPMSISEIADECADKFKLFSTRPKNTVSAGLARRTDLFERVSRGLWQIK